MTHTLQQLSKCRAFVKVCLFPNIRHSIELRYNTTASRFNTLAVVFCKLSKTRKYWKVVMLDIDHITQSINDARNITYRLRDLCTDTDFQQTDSFGHTYNVSDFDKIALGMQVYITSKLDYIERQLEEENNASGN